MRKIILVFFYLFYFYFKFYGQNDTTNDVTIDSYQTNMNEIEEPKFYLVFFNSVFDARFTFYLNNKCIYNNVIKSFGADFKIYDYTQPFNGDIKIDLTHKMYGETRNFSKIANLKGKKFALIILVIYYSTIDASYQIRYIVSEYDNELDLLIQVDSFEKEYRWKEY